MKILLVDDHPLFLQGMQAFLRSQGVEVVGVARSGPEALLKYEMLFPDLVLMDLQMSGCDGIETTRMIKKDYPEAVVVILTACEDEAGLLGAFQAGASGYLLKGMEPEEFLRQLNALSQGELPLDSGIAGRLLRKLALQETAAAETESPKIELSERQLEIVQLLIQGLSYKEMGKRLDLKEVTIKYHMSEMLSKFHLDNKAQLIAYLSKRGFI